MAERQPMRALIVDDEDRKIDEIRKAFEAGGNIVVDTALAVVAIPDLCEKGRLTSEKIDVAFIDSHLKRGTGETGGKEVLGILLRNELARRAYGHDPKHADFAPNRNKIVTVGTSSDPDWARNIGSYSDVLGEPLTIDWTIRPLELGSIIEEVRRLREMS